MKRMYAALGIIFLLMVSAVTCLGQKKTPDEAPSDAFEQRLRLREELHKKLRDKILRGFGSDFGADDDLIKDMEKLMEQSLSESFSGLNLNSGTATSNFKMEWTETQNDRTLIITPQGPEQKLDINVNNGQIVIKGMVEKKSAQGSALSSFSNSFPVPHDCEAAKVKISQKDGNILVSFPFKKATTKVIDKDQRKPLPPPQDGIEI